MSWPAGVGRIVLDEIDSTNAEARRRAEAGEDGPLWIMARRQTAARGRRGRPWEAPEGNLSATCLVRPAMRPGRAALLSFAAALAVAELLGQAAPAAQVSLKWPNDVLLNGRKVAGVLLESAGDTERLDWLAVGVGLNLAAAPETVAPDALPATSLAAEGAPPPAAEAALETLAAAFYGWADRLEREGFAPLRAAWLSRAARLGEPVRVRLPREELWGVLTDLGADGALVLGLAEGPRRIHAADVYF